MHGESHLKFKVDRWVFLEYEKLADVLQLCPGSNLQEDTTCWLWVNIKNEGLPCSEKTLKIQLPFPNEYLCEATFFSRISHEITSHNKRTGEAT